MLIIDDKFLIRSKNKHHREFLDGLIAPGNLFEFQPFTVDPGTQDSHFTRHYLPADSGEWEMFDAEPFVSFLTDILSDHGMELKHVNRCACNITYPNGKESSTPHVDHSYSHKQMLVYLNTSEGDTHIDNEESVSPKKYRCAIFDDSRHWHDFPKSGHRAVLVFTFSVK